MLILLYLSKIIWLILGIIVVILNSTSKKTFSDREKSSPFECGFDPKNSARVPFSLHFFLLAIIFIIFDIELALILPMIFVVKTSSLKYYTLTVSIFIILLLIGLIHEWKQGALTWST
uniref:NADH-ubiquinone oxidoreductase chain 3 n=1 Tax=Leptomias sp. DX-2020 TaxID=2748276 RepID=A0A7D9MYX3_9CUCU|nr:NADH dehydrogenase subunit 3 [Leptomias sp. DX-2020]